MNFFDVQKIAKELIRAEQEVKPIEPLSKQFPGLDIKTAYSIQLTAIKEKLTQKRKIVGKKIGLTSKPMQQLLGVNEPDYGHLLDNMLVTENSLIRRDQLLQPKVEGEIAFILNEDLKGPGVTIADVYNATKWVAPAIEIVDSRIKNWQITLADTVADNASSALFVIGDHMTSLQNLDIKHIGMVLEKNGEILQTGAGAAVLSHPCIAVAWLANKLSEFGVFLKAKEIILSGALSAAVNAEKNDTFHFSFHTLGSLTVNFM